MGCGGRNPPRKIRVEQSGTPFKTKKLRKNVRGICFFSNFDVEKRSQNVQLSKPITFFGEVEIKNVFGKTNNLDTRKFKKH